MQEATSKDQWSAQNDAALSSILHQRFQRLSPLDAFKARGKLLHEHLKKKDAGYGQSNQTQVKAHADTDAQRRSQYEDHRGSYTPSNPSPRSSIYTTASGFSDTSTVKSIKNLTRNMEQLDMHQDNPPDHSGLNARSRTPSNLLRTPELESIHSSPTGSAYSAASSAWSHSGRSQQSLYPTSPYSPHETAFERATVSLPSTPQSLSASKGSWELESSSSEIRSVKKENEMNDTAYSPRPRPQNQRRSSNGRNSSYRHASASVMSKARPDLQQRPTLTHGQSNRSTLPARLTKAPLSAIERFSSVPDHSLGAAEHIELGIEQHEQDQLPQSTHHFKVAADLGDPTGCMLYGLALRHGWGCRKDLSRSLHFLRLAADSATLNIENLRQSTVFKVPLEEIAVAVYELGVSYQNGWGVVSDKKASLKYFDLAASWGDVEAMAAAADCYANGRGCNKDKKKAATYLRIAESKGRKEVGNAWIWKEKYNPTSS